MFFRASTYILIRRRRKRQVPRQGANFTMCFYFVRARVCVLAHVQVYSGDKTMKTAQNGENTTYSWEEISADTYSKRKSQVWLRSLFTNVFVSPDMLWSTSEQSWAQLTKGSGPRTSPSLSPEPLRTAHSVHSRPPFRSAASCLPPPTPAPQNPGRCGRAPTGCGRVNHPRFIAAVTSRCTREASTV